MEFPETEVQSNQKWLSFSNNVSKPIDTAVREIQKFILQQR